VRQTGIVQKHYARARRPSSAETGHPGINEPRPKSHGLYVHEVRRHQEHQVGLSRAARRGGTGAAPETSLLAGAFVFVFVGFVGIGRAQEMREGPLRDVSALLAALHVRKAEVDAFPDAGVQHIIGCVREAVKR
jgi:hypothetical protein